MPADSQLRRGARRWPAARLNRAWSVLGYELPRCSCACRRHRATGSMTRRQGGEARADGLGESALAVVGSRKVDEGRGEKRGGRLDLDVLDGWAWVVLRIDPGYVGRTKALFATTCATLFLPSPSCRSRATRLTKMTRRRSSLPRIPRCRQPAVSFLLAPTSSGRAAFIPFQSRWIGS